MKYIKEFANFQDEYTGPWFWPMVELSKKLPSFILESTNSNSEIQKEKNFVRGYQSHRMVVPRTTMKKQGTFEVLFNNKFVGYITLKSSKSVTEEGFDNSDEIIFYEGGIMTDDNKFILNIDNIDNKLKNHLMNDKKI